MPKRDPLPEFIQLKRGDRHALVHPVDADTIAAALWDGADCTPVETGGRGPLLRFECNGEFGLVRRYLRGGLARHFMTEAYLFKRPGLKELAAHRVAYDRGLPVPKPLGVSWSLRGPLWRGAFATVELSGENLQSHLQRDRDANPEILAACGAAIRRMHDVGILHADLQVRNIFVHDGVAYLLDFDRARVLGTVGEALRQSNLLRLRRSFEKNGLAAPLFEQLRQGYERAS